MGLLAHNEKYESTWGRTLRSGLLREMCFSSEMLTVQKNFIFPHQCQVLKFSILAFIKQSSHHSFFLKASISEKDLRILCAPLDKILEISQVYVSVPLLLRGGGMQPAIRLYW